MPNDTTGKISDHFSSELEAEGMIEAAEVNAITAWEMQFVDGFSRRWESYRMDAFMTEAQFESLEKIAEK